MSLSPPLLPSPPPPPSPPLPLPLIPSPPHPLRPPCSDWYDREALMMREEGGVLTGLLMGLNALDYNVLLKGEEFDISVSALLTQYTRVY